MSRLAAVLLALLLAPWPGGPAPPGAEALRALQSWWAARLVEDAGDREDARTQLDRAERYARLGGHVDPYLFAAFQLGFDQSAPARGLPREEALARSLEAERRLDEALAWLPDPHEALKVHEFLVARRLLPLGGEELALERSRLPELLASGGPGLRGDPEAYREYLALDAGARNLLILDRLRRLGL